jgi:hypothetical protein
VHDAAMAVPALATEHQLALLRVEVRAPGDQLANVLRRLADHHLDNFPVAQIRSGNEGVIDVAVEVVLGIQNARDAALRERAVRLLHRVLSDHQQRQPRVDLHRSPQAGDAAPDDQHIGKVMRDALRMKRNEIAGSLTRHRFNLAEKMTNDEFRMTNDRRASRSSHSSFDIRHSSFPLLLPRTRYALVIRPQSILILERHWAAIAFLQIAHFIILHAVLLHRTAAQPEAPQRVIQLTPRLVSGHVVLLRRPFACFPTGDEFLQVVFSPAELLEHFFVNSLALELIREFFKHKVCSLPRVFEVGFIALRHGAAVAQRRRALTPLISTLAGGSAAVDSGVLRLLAGFCVFFRFAARLLTGFGAAGLVAFAWLYFATTASRLAPRGSLLIVGGGILSGTR